SHFGSASNVCARVAPTNTISITQVSRIMTTTLHPAYNCRRIHGRSSRTTSRQSQRLAESARRLPHEGRQGARDLRRQVGVPARPRLLLFPAFNETRGQEGPAPRRGRRL